MPRDTSFLSAPIIISTRLMEEKINRAIRQDLVADVDFDSKKRDGKRPGLKLKVSRLGPIAVRWKNNVARYEIPLAVLVERQIVPQKTLFLTKTLALKSEFSLRVAFETAVAVGEDWKMEPKTRFRSFEWLSEAKALGGLLDLKKMVERRMLRQMPETLHNLDSVIRADVHLEKPIRRVWRNLQKPIRINQKEQLVWLRIRPIQFEMGAITTEKGSLLIQTRLSATTETLVCDTPIYQIDSVLPRLVRRRSLPDSTFVHLLSEISFDEINALINQKMKGKTIDASGHPIRIKKAEVWGCGSDLMLHLSVGGDIRGDIYFRGEPFYDPDSQQIGIRNFDFELQTEEALEASADWLLHDSFKIKVASALRLELADKFLAIPTAIEKGIERGRAGRKMDFQIEHFSFRPQKIWVQPTGLAALVLVDARVRIELETL